MRDLAERQRSAPACPSADAPPDRDGTSAEAALRLRWLCPSSNSLVTLCRPITPSTWPLLRADPGAVLLLLRDPASSEGFPHAPLRGPALLEHALALLEPAPDSPHPFVDWGTSPASTVYRACRTVARLARRAALAHGGCDPERAWACGLLAPLGWLALCAADPGGVSACLADLLGPGSRAAQLRRWGIDHPGLARRLARRWGLPGWLASLGHLGLPTEKALRLGADPVLFPLVRLALRRAGEQGADLGLAPQSFRAEDERALGADSWPPDWADAPDEEGSPAWDDPLAQPLTRDLLRLAAENRRLHDVPLHSRLEREVDELHRTLEEQVHEADSRLLAGKLGALAEFAAGAGHEINNPLAVISGQAQYLLGHLPKEESEGGAPSSDSSFLLPPSSFRKALAGIIAQTRRIHGVLRDVMQFARPAPARPAWVDLPTLMGEVAASLGEFAAGRRVRVEVHARPERLAVHADGEQVRTALACLLRNAVEAAPPEGWARLVLLAGPEGPAEVAVEDSGPGPPPGRHDSLFDPFYSGRSAGRGRGLGLPIAWRLARQQGGDVRIDHPRPGEPTRFVLSLPRAAPEERAHSEPGAPDDRHAA